MSICSDDVSNILRPELEAFCREATGEHEKNLRIFGKSFRSGWQVLPRSFCSRCKVL